MRLTARQFYQFRRKLSAAKLENGINSRCWGEDQKIILSYNFTPWMVVEVVAEAVIEPAELSRFPKILT